MATKLSKTEFAVAIRENRPVFIRARRAKANFLALQREGLEYEAGVDRLQDMRAAILAGWEAYHAVCGVMWDAMFTIREIDGVIATIDE